MSAINGDKARFNRARKAKISRRARKRKLFLNLKQQASSASPASPPSKASL